MNPLNLTTAPTQGISSLNAPAQAEMTKSQTLPGEDFASVLQSMLGNVNQAQQHSRQLAESFEKGQHQNLAEVMIAQQTAKLGFQSTLQVRNKLVTAYQDVMNMPI